jgi:hypothetical protein
VSYALTLTVTTFLFSTCLHYSSETQKPPINNNKFIDETCICGLNDISFSFF